MSVLLSSHILSSPSSLDSLRPSFVKILLRLSIQHRIIFLIGDNQSDRVNILFDACHAIELSHSEAYDVNNKIVWFRLDSLNSYNSINSEYGGEQQTRAHTTQTNIHTNKQNKTKNIEMYYFLTFKHCFLS